MVLFAALSYVVTGGMTGGGKNASRESSAAIASELYQYLALMDNTLERMRLVQDCKEGQFDLSNTVWRFGPSGPNADQLVFQPNHNAAAPADGRCKLFSYMPAQISEAAKIDTSSNGWALSMNPWIASYSVPDIGTSLRDLVIVYPAVPLEVCKAFNRLAGINLATDGTPLGNGGWPISSYTGIYNGASSFNSGNTGNSLSTGLRDFCSGNATSNYIMHVLLPR